MSDGFRGKQREKRNPGVALIMDHEPARGAAGGFGDEHLRMRSSATPYSLPEKQPKEASMTELPGAAAKVAQQLPALWRAIQALGEEAGKAGPLDARTRRLIHLAFAIASDSEGATHSHTRRALDEGVSAEELHHVAYLAVTTLGWPHAIRGLTWVQDCTRPSGG
jgi:alkylhydroperoxidase/carboxymuconolactone decarboxylase family protein YurZ